MRNSGNEEWSARDAARLPRDAGEAAGQGGAGGSLRPLAREAMDAARNASDLLRSLSPESLSDAELLEINRLLFADGEARESIRLGFLRELDRRPEAVKGARAGTVAKTFSLQVLHRTETQARADLDAAEALDPERTAAQGGLPRLAAAFAAGEVSREHVKVAVAATKQIPNRFRDVPAEDIADVRAAGGAPVKDLSGGDLIDQLLVNVSREHSTRSARKITAHLLATLDPSGRDRFDAEAHTRRTVVFAVDGTGMMVGNFQLDPANAALVIPVVNVLSAPRPEREELDAEGEAVLVRDERTAGQRRADAFGEMARLAAAALIDPLDHLEATSPRSGVPGSAQPGGALPASEAPGTMRHPRSLTPRIVITATPEQVQDAFAGTAGAGAAEAESLGPISGTHLATSLCDATLQRVLTAPSGSVLDLGRSIRTVTPAQKLALTVRDGGCVIPGCTLPAAWCDAHHVQWWSHGGPSDLSNYALLCSNHHHQVHAGGGYEIEMIDGIPWVRPPTWIDRNRRLIRNTFRDHQAHALALGRQLRRALSADGSDPPNSAPPSSEPPDEDPPRLHPNH